MTRKNAQHWSRWNMRLQERYLRPLTTGSLSYVADQYDMPEGSLYAIDTLDPDGRRHYVALTADEIHRLALTLAEVDHRVRSIDQTNQALEKIGEAVTLRGHLSRELLDDIRGGATDA